MLSIINCLELDLSIDLLSIYFRIDTTTEARSTRFL